MIATWTTTMRIIHRTGAKFSYTIALSHVQKFSRHGGWEPLFCGAATQFNKVSYNTALAAM